MRIFLGEQGNIVCLAINETKNGRKVYYEADPHALLFFGRRCYPTFAGSNELVVLTAYDTNRVKGAR